MSRQIDYLELCQFVSAKQTFAIRWLDRYARMGQLYWTQSRLVRAQIDALWAAKYELTPDEHARHERLYEQWEHLQLRLKRCWQMHSVLLRYGQYFSNLPFRVLRNQPIPDCYWYVPDSKSK